MSIELPSNIDPAMNLRLEEWVPQFSWWAFRVCERVGEILFTDVTELVNYKDRITKQLHHTHPMLSMVIEHTICI
jgi:hypothetical protein